MTAERFPNPSDPELYGFWPYKNRPKVVWPGGKKIAVWVAPNIEFYEMEPPANPHRKSWPRPAPDVVGYGHRDFGNRVGHWRLMEVMDKYAVRGSVSLSVSMCQHIPEIIEECAQRDWEFFSHGVYNTRYCLGMDEAEERALIEDCIRTIKDATGQVAAGWLGPALTYTVRSLDLLAEYGFKYTSDLFHDDQPQPVKTKKGRMISLPYSLEVNDHYGFFVYNMSPRQYADTLKRQFDQLLEEGEDSGTVMCIPLHAYLIGQAHRIGPFAEVLAHVTAHEDAWVATGREIADYYMDNYYDAALVDLARYEKGD